jgi:hypothetical protein
VVEHSSGALGEVHGWLLMNESKVTIQHVRP